MLKTLIPVQKEVLTSDGLWYMLGCLPYRTADHVIDGVVLTFTDVTRLKDSEKAILEARDYAENILHTPREALLVLDPELKVISANQAFYETFQVSPEETEGLLIYELGNHQWNIPDLRRLLEKIFPTNSAIDDFEVRYDFPKIGPKIINLNARKMYEREGKHTRCILLALADVTERRRGDEARARLAAVVESSEDAIISKNLDGIVTSWNAGAERLFGYRAEEMIGQPITRIIPPDREEEGKDILRRVRRGEPVDHLDTVRVTRDKRPVPVSLTVSPIKDPQGNIIGASKIASDITERKQIEEARQEFSRELEKKVSERTAELEQANRALVRDIEERKRLEDQLRQAHKMESIGTLVAGVAHDFNNILNIIQGYASLLKEHGANNEEIAESGSVIIGAAKRGAGVVQQLLTLARKTEPRLEPTDVNKLLRELMHLLQESFPKVIQLNLVANHELPPVTADPNQINQALLNLCVNARDAMPDGGKLTLKTEVVAGESLREDGEANAERYVCIAITDTGTGIDEDIQSRVFEPFFTTKRTDRGTGLGLSVVYGIVKNHNGFIQVESKPMHGATFRVYLPVASSGN